ncbi:MAG TPA: twin-arginine translocase TatA/TatE family subunit [Caldithrix abyssi]|uniref:Sec-independent protein translocase protein TatA n=1 Tax=Caldithrix abyssi TaxID=187145 RepID=A0A7V4U3C1_CALAY|nr:twin-arginine translocase TatA/TatE family subunit [Caldithrix abyssi]
MNFGMTEILIILFIILLLFGAKRIPDLARSLGSSVKSFKKGITDQEEEDASS